MIILITHSAKYGLEIDLLHQPVFMPLTHLGHVGQEGFELIEQKVILHQLWGQQFW